MTFMTALLIQRLTSHDETIVTDVKRHRKQYALIVNSIS